MKKYQTELLNTPYRVLINCIFRTKTTESSHDNVTDIEAIVDSGCANTLLPLWVAKACGGLPLPMIRMVRVAGNTTKAQAFVIPEIEIGDFTLKSVMVLAADFQGELEDRMLLGPNVMNNWRFTVDRSVGKTGVFEFEEKIPGIVPRKDVPYRNYFDNAGKYILLEGDETTLI